MTYLQKNRKPRKSFLRNIGIALIVIGLVVGIKLLAGSAIDRMAMSIGGPITSVYTGFKSKLSFAGSFLSSRSSLVEENKRLSTDLDIAQNKLLRFDSVIQENRDILAAYHRTPFAGKAVLANITAKPPQSPYDVLLADIGSNDGIAKGDRVYAVGGIPLGRVDEVTGSTAKIVMFSSFGEQSQVIHERTGSTITLTGNGGGNLESDVAQEMDIEKDDAILLPQFDGAVVANVVDVESTVTGSTKKVLFRIPINIFHIRWVEIMKSTPENAQ